MLMSERSRVLSARANRAAFAIWVVIGTMALFMITEIADAAGMGSSSTMTQTVAYFYLLAGLASTLAFITSVVLVAMWIHCAHANLHESATYELNFTPGWAVGWYFVPIMNLFKPYQAMRELWNTSMGQWDNFGAEAPGDLKLWWGGWIVGNLLGNVSSRMAMMGDGSNIQIAGLIGVVSTGAIIISAWILLRMIREITGAQQGGLGTADVFA